MISKAAEKVSSGLTYMSEYAREHFDNWSNFMTGVGTAAYDKVAGAMVTWFKRTPRELASLYAADATAAKIVDLPIEDAFREGYIIKGIEGDISTHIWKRIRELQVETRLIEFLRLGRLDGGSAMLRITDDVTNVDRPMSKNERLANLVVLSRSEVEIDETLIQYDPRLPNFRKPLAVRIRTQGQTTEQRPIFDMSRVFQYEGVWLPPELRSSADRFGDSVLSRCFGPLRNYNMCHDGAAHVVQDFSIGLYKIKGLVSAVAANQGQAILDRIRMVDKGSSLVRAKIVDQDNEDFSYATRSVSGLAEIMSKVDSRLVASTPFPHTVLMGNSPTGSLGQSGNHETTNYYDYVRSIQVNQIVPVFLAIVKQIALEVTNEIDQIDIEFNPLYQTDDKENATTEKLRAETAALYRDMGVVSQDEIRNELKEREVYPMDEEVEVQDPEIVATTTATQPQIAGGTDVQKSALNGAQVTSLVDVVSKAAGGEISRESAIAIIMQAFQVERSAAEEALGPVTFKPVVDTTASATRVDGGPGSGCNGPNCGRPEGSGSGDNDGGGDGGGSGRSLGESKASFKSADRKVDTIGRQYDRNPTPENEAKLTSAIQDRNAAADAHVKNVQSKIDRAKAITTALKEKPALEAQAKEYEDKLKELSDRRAALQAASDASKERMSALKSKMKGTKKRDAVDEDLDESLFDFDVLDELIAELESL